MIHVYILVTLLYYINSISLSFGSFEDFYNCRPTFSKKICSKMAQWTCIFQQTYNVTEDVHWAPFWNQTFLRRMYVCVPLTRVEFEGGEGGEFPPPLVYFIVAFSVLDLSGNPFRSSFPPPCSGMIPNFHVAFNMHGTAGLLVYSFYGISFVS